MPPEYFRRIYKKAGNTILIASIIAFISAALFLFTALSSTKTDVPSAFALVPLIYFGILIALPIWGHHAIKKALTREASRLEIEQKELIEQQKAAEEEAEKVEKERKTQEIYENLPIVPRYTTDVTNPTFRSIIAGIGHHYPYTGGFAGYIIPEPNNPYDENAMAIYILDKKIGYIPKRDNIHYKDWCNNQPMPCVGCIYYKDGKYIGVLRAIRYSNIENLTKIVNDFFEWFRQNEADVEVPENLHFCVKIEPEEEGGEMEFI